VLHSTYAAAILENKRLGRKEKRVRKALAYSSGATLTDKRNFIVFTFGLFPVLMKPL
jgi:hypothetical protein